MKSVKKRISSNPLNTVHKFFIEKHWKRGFMTGITTCVGPVGHDTAVFRFRNGNLDRDILVARLSDVLKDHIWQKVRNNEIG